MSAKKIAKKAAPKKPAQKKITPKKIAPKKIAGKKPTAKKAAKQAKKPAAGKPTLAKRAAPKRAQLKAAPVKKLAVPVKKAAARDAKSGAEPTLHMVRLAVGATDLASMREWIRESRTRWKGRAAVPCHTRHMPKRLDELLPEGSLYWVIKGTVRCRQRLLGFETVEGEGGESWCRFYVEPTLVETRSRPMRPFQGWRYLKAADAPADAGSAEAGGDELPDHILSELRELGLM